ncbi:MAG TPA: glycosyltransferase family 2 protein [Daejeonella sp.]|nr:glycosyltransferase family 2 protein [Daejeonella sp.]
MKNYPKISIVTPSFNQGQYLEEAMLSVISQGYPNLEYIVIDGGSADNSVEIIKKYEQYLAYWVSEKDAGMYHAVQKGFERSNGEIMAWINSDDKYHQKSLFSLAALFEHYPNIHWLMGKNTFYTEDGLTFVADWDKKNELWSKWRLYNFDGFIQQESVFWRRSLWEKAGAYIDPQWYLAADLELWARFFRYETLYSTNFILSGFRFRNENQKSKDYRQQYMEQAHAILKREKELNGDGPYLLYCLLMKYLSKLMPGKYKKRLLYKTLKFPQKIDFMPDEGFLLR